MINYKKMIWLFKNRFEVSIEELMDTTGYSEKTLEQFLTHAKMEGHQITKTEKGDYSYGGQRV